MRRILTAFALALTCSQASAGYDDAVEAYQRGDHAVAIREFRALAERGVVVAYTNLGYMYALGEGVTADPAQAAEWFRRAAEAGSAAAQVTLGVLYFNGEGVERDFPVAYGWFNLASTNGRDDALDYMNTVAGRMRYDDLERAQRIARALFDEFGDADLRGPFERPPPPPEPAS